MDNNELYEKFADVSDESISEGMSELIEEQFRVKRWVDAAGKTMARIDELKRSHPDLEDDLTAFMGDMLEAGLILTKAARRGRHMLETAEELKTRKTVASMLSDIEKALRKDT